MSDEKDEQNSHERLIETLRTLFGSSNEVAGPDRDKSLRESASLLGTIAADISTKQIRKRYWLIPRGIWRNLIAICSVLVALCTLAAAILGWLTNTRIDAKAKAQEYVTSKIGDLEASHALDRINEAAQATTRGSALDRLGSLESQVGYAANRYLITRKGITLSDIVNRDPDKATKYKPDAGNNIIIDCPIDVGAPSGYHLLASANEGCVIAWAVPHENPQNMSGVLSIDSARGDPKTVWLYYHGPLHDVEAGTVHSDEFGILIYCVWERDNPATKPS